MFDLTNIYYFLQFVCLKEIVNNIFNAKVPFLQNGEKECTEWTVRHMAQPVKKDITIILHLLNFSVTALVIRSFINITNLQTDMSKWLSYLNPWCWCLLLQKAGLLIYFNSEGSLSIQVCPVLFTRSTCVYVAQYSMNSHLVFCILPYSLTKNRH